MEKFTGVIGLMVNVSILIYWYFYGITFKMGLFIAIECVILWLYFMWISIAKLR